MLGNCPFDQLLRTGPNGIHDVNSECAQMSGIVNKPPVTGKWRHARGFSMVELLVVVAIIMVVSGLAIPQITLTLRSYQVTSSASQVGDAIKFSRFEAIRRNNAMSFLTSWSGVRFGVGTDSNGDGVLQVSERQYELTGNVTLLTAAAVPTSGNLPGALNVPAVTVLSGNAATQAVAFDPRGAVNFAASAGGVPTVYVLYVGPTSLSTQDYRAVVIMPSGLTQVWAGSAGSPWHQIS
jgi:prepilin-type N-terminal cleavage/methylation domain-containing protein